MKKKPPIDEVLASARAAKVEIESLEAPELPLGFANRFTPKSDASRLDLLFQIRRAAFLSLGVATVTAVSISLTMRSIKSEPEGSATDPWMNLPALELTP